MKTQPENIQQLLTGLKHRPVHSLGQNFLIDEMVVNQIIEAGFAPFSKGAGELNKESTIDPRSRVLEIGPGLGVLTESILKKLPKGGQLIALEKDHTLAENLGRILHHPRNLKLLETDATVFDRSYHYQEGQFMVMANLPFNISSFIINSLLTQSPRPARLVLMLQKEVAERVLAGAGHSARGLLSVIAEWYANGQLVCQVPKTSFYPEPKVEAAVIKLEIKKSVEVVDQQLFKLVKAGFAQRRKNLKNSLAAGLGLGKEGAEQLLKKAGINPNSRAQDLTLEQWCTLVKLTKN